MVLQLHLYLLCCSNQGAIIFAIFCLRFLPSYLPTYSTVNDLKFLMSKLSVKLTTESPISNELQVFSGH